MGITKKSIVLFVVFSFVICASIAEVYADTHKAASCSYFDVSSAISSASAGDTVIVPSGSCTWSSTLKITKGINLIGSGIGNTVIKRASSCIIVYVPSDYDLNQTFRLSGFSFNGASGAILQLGEEMYPTAKPAQTNVRVDNNRFYSSTSCDMNDIAIEHFGNIFGVVDNNTIDDYAYPMRNQNPSAYGVLWDAAIDIGLPGYPLGIPGSIYNLYFEDNTINLSLSGGEAAITNSQFEGRYAYRYNTINFPASGQSWPLFDVHPYNDSSMHAPFITENYGNRLVTNGSSIGYVNIRGAINFWHHNSVTTSVDWSTSGSTATCPAAKYRPYEPITDTYFFQNRIGYTGSLLGAAFDGGGAYSCNGHTNPTEGTDFFDDVDSSPGVTCGTLANLPENCSVGQGYWATDQSCTDLTGMVGVNPQTPISGTLYKCTKTNTWTVFYTPYTYPHLLRTGTVDTVPPAPPTNPHVIY